MNRESRSREKRSPSAGSRSGHTGDQGGGVGHRAGDQGGGAGGAPLSHVLYCSSVWSRVLQSPGYVMLYYSRVWVELYV